MAREKLTITGVLEPRTIGDKNIPLQEFYADGKKYSVFSKSLFPYIKLNTEIDAEVETKEGESWTNRKVIDIFVNGQSVKAQGQGGGYRGKSPEELELSRRSFALSYAKDLAVAGIIPVKDIPSQATEFYNWLHNEVKPTATAVKDTEDKPSPVKGEEIESSVPEGSIRLTQHSSITTEQKERLKELQEKLPRRSKQLIREWGWNVEKIAELTKDQANHLIEVMDKEVK